MLLLHVVAVVVPGRGLEGKVQRDRRDDGAYSVRPRREGRGRYPSTLERYRPI